jgi:hypothetical protein
VIYLLQGLFGVADNLSDFAIKMVAVFLIRIHFVQKGLVVSFRINLLHKGAHVFVDSV